MDQKEAIGELIKYKDYLVPVIGDELFYVEKKESPLHKFIVECFEKKFPEVAENLSEEERKIMYGGGFDGFALLSRRYNADGLYAKNYIDFIEKHRSQIKLNDTVKEYILKTKPDLIITTSSFSLLEKELGLDRNTSLWYSIDDNQTQNKKSLSPKSTTIYHLFGDAELPMADWVYNDASLLKFVHSLHDNHTSPEGLTQYLKKKYLFILGCKLPNWFFQFILYPLNQELITDTRPSRQGFWLRGSNEEHLQLRSFLDGIKFLSIENIENILEEVNKQINTVSSSNNAFNDNWDIFISHAGEDKDLAHKIFEYLENKKGLRVWLDQRGGKGETEKAGDYLERIQYGIEHSRYFMPIVTSVYLAKCRKGDFGKETDMAIEWFKDGKNDCNAQKGIKVYSLPIVIDQHLYNIGKELKILPEELFGTNHYYVYTGKVDDGKDTFLSNQWENFKRENS